MLYIQVRKDKIEGDQTFIGKCVKQGLDVCLLIGMFICNLVGKRFKRDLSQKLA